MSTIQSLQIAAARMPVLSLPAQMSVGKHGQVGFTLDTAAGPIAVEAWSTIRHIAQLIDGATLIPGDPFPRGGNVVSLRRG